MSIQTNLSVSPYFDQHSDSSDYYRILFKPSTAVQTRELNELQQILQSQIEKFGDVVLKTGTLLEGCQATFNTELPFVKLKDITAKGSAVNLRRYVGLFARGDTNNVKARILDAIDGFEAQDPNLKTLYLNYIDSGTQGDAASFEENETLTIFSPDHRLYGVEVRNGSTAFSNGDSLVFLSAIEVQNTTGGSEFSNGVFEEGELITQATTNAQAEIVGVQSANSSLILRLKPLDVELAQGNVASWSFADNSDVEFAITSNTTNNEAVIRNIIGSGAAARFQTSPAGTIRDVITITRGGSGYTTPPFVTISRTIPTGDTNNYTALDLRAENFVDRVQIASEAEEGIESPTTGFGYSMSVTGGSIYQNGHFLRVSPQSIIVSKYSNVPNEVAVGFVTNESIANAAIDPSLNDNAAGSFNENAPGADRLVLRPRLAVREFRQLSGNTQFFPIFKFSEGQVFSQRNNVQFNKIADELARRTYEESGNYVLNTFDITTRSTLDIANSDSTFTYLIDPGLAYINGYRVETIRNFAKNVSKSTETTSVTSSLDVVYGNYVRVNEFAGFHAFTIGEQVELHSVAQNALSEDIGVVTDPDAKIGTARVRSVVHESGIQGTASAVYRVYLFSIEMESGQNFRNVRSVYSTDGVADVITELDASTATQVAVLKGTTKNSLVFSTRRPVKELSELEYQFRTKKTGVIVTQDGTISLANTAGAQWPYSGSLTTAQQNELIVIPEEDLISSVDATGDIVTSNNTTLTGSGTLFGAEIQVGDYIQVGPSTTVYITSISSATSAEYGPPGAISPNINAPTSFRKVYPKNVPLPIASRENITAEIQGTSLIIDADITIAAAETATVVYNQKVVNAEQTVNKPAERKVYVKIQANTHPNGVDGPWPLGVPDAFRLRAVYKGEDVTDQNITQSFFIDTNQNENYLGTSKLKLRSQAVNPIGPDDIILVEFDCYRASGEGVKTVQSYVIKDNLSLEELDEDIDNAVNTLEIPEFGSRRGYFDLRESLDFRPAVANTVAYATTPGAANTNPTISTSFFGDNLKFPVPEGDAFFNMDFYRSRTDIILLNASGEFEFVIGKELKVLNPNQFPLYKVNVPPYPSLPLNLSSAMKQINDRKVATGSFSNTRRDRFTIVSEQLSDQVQGYTMEEISSLEKRISVLEFFAQLSETEDQIKDLSIPSSIDSAIDRFKFGFFVDSFSNYNLSDLSSPEFNSLIYQFVLQPGSIGYNVPLRVAGGSLSALSGTKVSFPYESVSFLSQNFATTGPREIVQPPVDPVDPVEPRPVIPGPPPFTTRCVTTRNQTQNYTKVNSPSQYAAVSTVDAWPSTAVISSAVYTLAANTDADGQSITLSFDMGWGTTRLVIEQSRSPSAGFTRIFDTQSNLNQVQTLSLNERRTLRNSIIGDWNSPNFNDFSASNVDDPLYQSSSYPVGFLKWVGKIVIPYSVAGGRFIRVTAQKASPNFLYQICFPADEVADPIFGRGGSLFAISSPELTDSETVINLPPIDEGPRDECRVSTEALLLIRRGIIDDPCAPPKDEPEPIILPALPDPRDIEEPVATPIDTIDKGEPRIPEPDPPLIIDPVIIDVPRIEPIVFPPVNTTPITFGGFDFSGFQQLK